MTFKHHKDIVEPNTNAKVWRYLDFTKFVSMLDKKELWFSGVDKLDDPFEGTLSKLSGYLEDITPGQSDEYDNIVKTFHDLSKKWRKWTAVNCWHLNEYESAAMWGLHAKGDCGISIQSTFGRLKESFSSYLDNSVYAGMVQYGDYEKFKIPVNFGFLTAFYKRLSFEHEREVRALVITLEKGGDLNKKPKFLGHSIPVDLNTLIERIYVAPKVEEWKLKLVKNILSKYKLEKPVCQSALDKVPY